MRVVASCREPVETKCRVLIAESFRIVEASTEVVVEVREQESTEVEKELVEIVEDSLVCRLIVEGSLMCRSQAQSLRQSRSTGPFEEVLGLELQNHVVAPPAAQAQEPVRTRRESAESG